MNQWLDIKNLFPGIKGQFVHSVNLSKQNLLESLEQNNFLIININGQKIIDEVTFFQEVVGAFNFPEYFGKNWDAWTDSLYDFGQTPPAYRIAIIWEDADRTINSNLQVFLQAVFDLYNLASFLSIDSTKKSKGGSNFKQVEIFLLGKESGFQKIIE